MARFSGSYDETFTVSAPRDVVRNHFSSLDAIIANYGPIERVDKIGDDTLKFLIQEKQSRGVRYQGRYTCKYTVESDSRMSWRTLSEDNMWSTGSAEFREVAGGTEVRYSQRMETEIGVPRLLAKFAKGIVGREISAGIAAYLGRMRAAFPTK